MINDEQMWKTMETAPHDKRVMVWSGQEMYCAHWAKNQITDDEAWIVAEWGSEGDQALVKPTHWHPLPLPPPNVEFRPPEPLLAKVAPGTES